MKKIIIHCSNCQESFNFSHPSVNSARDLSNVTLDCPACNATLKTPNDEVHMITMAEYMERSMRRHGVEVSSAIRPTYISLVEAPSQ